MASTAHYIVGIDLGTTNIVVSYLPIGEQVDAEILQIPQLVGPGQVAARPRLPAFRYHHGGEISADQMPLPWPSGSLASRLPSAVLGQWAQELGSRTPGRLVQSAKSWLSAERSEPVRLPWQAGDGVETVTPVEATASYLEHIRLAWDQQFPKQPLHRQRVLVTVPASFDELARTLTLEAAHQAGMPTLQLLEEPQAACYDWLRQHPDQAQLKQCQRLLVCDVGGGTSDFSLIAVTDSGKEQPALERIGVGDHLMLGGDNMDLTLALQVQRKLAVSKPNPRQVSAVLQQCQQAKCLLLSDQAPDEVGITVLGTGSGLVGGSQRTRLSRKEVQRQLLEGFLPRVELKARPRQRSHALRQFGLPYPPDAAISRHLAQFLGRFVTDDDSEPEALQRALPDAVLVNGSPFFSPLLKARLAEQLAHWRGSELTWLENPAPDLAVARGAAYFGWLKVKRRGLIRSGTARNYYILADSPSGKQAICLLPKGTAQGERLSLSQPVFNLQCGSPVQFELASSDEVDAKTPGSRLEDLEQLHNLPKLVTELTGQGQQQVVLSAELTEIGLLDIQCQALNNPEHHWPVAFNLRQHEQGARPSAALQQALDACQPVIAASFGSASQVQRNAVATLRRDLEKLLGPRLQWRAELARGVADQLIALRSKRRRSARHERTWFNLLGFCLRPGSGLPGDRERIDTLWPLYKQGLQHQNDPQLQREWWIFWRRLVAGLDENQQSILLDDAGVVLVPGYERTLGKKSAEATSVEERLRLVGSLERIPVDLKCQVGELLISRIQDGVHPSLSAWALARFGARVQAYANEKYRVAAADIRQWLTALLSLDWRAQPELCFAAASLCRLSGQDAVDDEMQQQIIDKLRRSRAASAWISWVTEPTDKQQRGERHIWGDSLPAGLQLIQ